MRGPFVQDRLRGAVVMPQRFVARVPFCARLLLSSVFVSGPDYVICTVFARRITAVCVCMRRVRASCTRVLCVPAKTRVRVAIPRTTDRVAFCSFLYFCFAAYGVACTHICRRAGFGRCVCHVARGRLILCATSEFSFRNRPERCADARLGRVGGTDVEVYWSRRDDLRG